MLQTKHSPKLGSSHLEGKLKVHLATETCRDGRREPQLIGRTALGYSLAFGESPMYLPSWSKATNMKQTTSAEERRRMMSRCERIEFSTATAASLGRWRYPILLLFLELKVLGWRQDILDVGLPPSPAVPCRYQYQAWQFDARCCSAVKLT